MTKINKTLTSKNDKTLKRLNVTMDRTTYMDMKHHCVQNDISLSEITRNLWLEYMKMKM